MTTIVVGVAADDLERGQRVSVLTRPAKASVSPRVTVPVNSDLTCA